MLSQIVINVPPLTLSQQDTGDIRSGVSDRIMCLFATFAQQNELNVVVTLLLVIQQICVQIQPIKLFN